MDLPEQDANVPGDECARNLLIVFLHPEQGFEYRGRLGEKFFVGRQDPASQMGKNLQILLYTHLRFYRCKQIAVQSGGPSPGIFFEMAAQQSSWQ